jgi:HK97 family phage prohead protease
MASTENKRPVTERRVFNLDLSKCEVRTATDDGPAVFSGYAAVFNELSVNLGGFRERIKQGAFRDAVDENQDVRFLINHNADLVLGRTRSGTVTLGEDEVGLRVECELPNTTFANDLIESMSRGDVDQMSFGFVTRADSWPEKDAETGLPIRELLRADLFDVSVVTYPAYPDTTAEVRSEIAERNPELLERAAQAAAELDADTTDTTEASAEEASELSAEEVRERFEELRAEAGARVDEGHPQCDGFAVVWNFNDEMQSCHASREAAETQLEAMTSGAAAAARADEPEQQEEADEERAGKVLSQSNNDKIDAATKLLQEVLAAGQDKTGIETVEANDARPDMAAFRAQLEERGWSWDDDWNVWSLTQMIESASCFLLYADEDEEEDAPAVAAMKAIVQQLAALLASVVAEGARTSEDGEQRDQDEPEEEKSETPAPLDERARMRRRLGLLEREITVV